ncbi:hypothetical protein A9F07_13590 [Klebsiella pneumoniae]|nr:hypothetical protein A9F07_13590 [Klebsiella pneumoniae]
MDGILYFFEIRRALASKKFVPVINPIHCYFKFVTAHTGNNFYDSFIFWDKTYRFRHVKCYEFTSFNTFIRMINHIKISRQAPIQ